MKKLILITFIINLCLVNAFSQIQFKIESPSSIAGNVGFTTTADPGVSPAGWTATPDLNDTANAPSPPGSLGKGRLVPPSLPRPRESGSPSLSSQANVPERKVTKLILLS